MNNTDSQHLKSNQQIDQEKKEIMLNIKSLQRDLIKASFKQSSAPSVYAELLLAINNERAKIKELNQAVT